MDDGGFRCYLKGLQWLVCAKSQSIVKSIECREGMPAKRGDRIIWYWLEVKNRLYLVRQEGMATKRKEIGPYSAYMLNLKMGSEIREAHALEAWQLFYPFVKCLHRIFFLFIPGTSMDTDKTLLLAHNVKSTTHFFKIGWSIFLQSNLRFDTRERLKKERISHGIIIKFVNKLHHILRNDMWWNRRPSPSARVSTLTTLFPNILKAKQRLGSHHAEAIDLSDLSKEQQ